jgi:hypothetical protein
MGLFYPQITRINQIQGRQNLRSYAGYGMLPECRSGQVPEFGQVLHGQSFLPNSKDEQAS